MRAKHGAYRFWVASVACPFDIVTNVGETFPELSALPRVVYSVDEKGATPAESAAVGAAEMVVALNPRVRLNLCVKMLSS